MDLINKTIIVYVSILNEAIYLSGTNLCIAYPIFRMGLIKTSSFSYVLRSILTVHFDQFDQGGRSSQFDQSGRSSLPFLLSWTLLETFLSRFNLQAHTDAAAGEQGAASGLGGTSECSRVDHEQISTACYKVRKSTLNDQKLILEDKVIFSRLVNAPNPDFTNINQLKIQVYWTFF